MNRNEFQVIITKDELPTPSINKNEENLEFRCIKVQLKVDPPSMVQLMHRPLCSWSLVRGELVHFPKHHPEHQKRWVISGNDSEGHRCSYNQWLGEDWLSKDGEGWATSIAVSWELCLSAHSESLLGPLLRLLSRLLVAAAAIMLSWKALLMEVFGSIWVMTRRSKSTPARITRQH